MKAIKYLSVIGENKNDFNLRPLQSSISVICESIRVERDRDDTTAHNLFSMFTADIIKSNTFFVR